MTLAMILIESCCSLPYLNASSQAFSTVLRSLVVIFCLTLRPSIVDFILKQYLVRADKKPLLNIMDSYVSNSFLAAIFSRWASSSALNFSASFTWAGKAQMKQRDQLTIFSMSSFESLPLSLVMVILFWLPVLLSQADTFNTPLASISKVTCGEA